MICVRFSLVKEKQCKHIYIYIYIYIIYICRRVNHAKFMYMLINVPMFPCTHYPSCLTPSASSQQNGGIKIQLWTTAMQWRHILTAPPWFNVWVQIHLCNINIIYSIYIYICIHVSNHMYRCMHVYIYIYIYTVYMHIYVYIYIYVCVCLCI